MCKVGKVPKYSPQSVNSVLYVCVAEHSESDMNFLLDIVESDVPGVRYVFTVLVRMCMYTHTQVVGATDDGHESSVH